MAAALGVSGREDARPLQVMLNAYIQATATPAVMDIDMLEHVLLGWSGLQVPAAALQAASERVANLLDTAAAEPDVAPRDGNQWLQLMASSMHLLRYTFDIGVRDDGRLATAAAWLTAKRPIDVLSTKIAGRAMCRFALRKACAVRSCGCCAGRASSQKSVKPDTVPADRHSARAAAGGPCGGALVGGCVGVARPHANRHAVGRRHAT